MLFYVRVVYLILQLHLSSQTFDCFLASSAAVKNVTEGEDINLMSYKSSLVAFFLMWKQLQVCQDYVAYQHTVDVYYNKSTKSF